MPNKSLNKLLRARSRLARLESSLARALKRELAALPGKFGFKSEKEFFRAVKAAQAGGKRRGRRKRHPRSKITAEIKQDVKRLAAQGKKGAEIASELKISTASVANIKRELGIARKRK